MKILAALMGLVFACVVSADQGAEMAQQNTFRIVQMLEQNSKSSVKVTPRGQGLMPLTYVVELYDGGIKVRRELARQRGNVYRTDNRGEFCEVQYDGNADGVPDRDRVCGSSADYARDLSLISEGMERRFGAPELVRGTRTTVARN